MATRTKIGERPQGGSGGDPNILKLGDSTKIRIVDVDQITWRQHIVEDQADPDQVEFVVCPGPGRCPMCRKPTNQEGKQRWPVQVRYGTNVWSYDDNGVKVLIAGKTIFEEFAAARDVGFDPLACDWVIHKKGSGKQTKYKLVRGNEEAPDFEVGPDDMHDLDKYGNPKSEEQIFEILEKAGWDYDSLEVQTFTEEEALEFQMPYGKMKGLTIEQVLAQDESYAEYMHDAKQKDGQFGDPVFLALHTAMEARGKVPPLAEVEAKVAERPSEPVQQPEEAPAAQGDGKVKLQSPDGDEAEVPENAVDSLLAAGFTRIEQSPPEPTPEPTLEISDDTEVAVTVGGADATLEFGKALAIQKSGADLEFKDADARKAAEQRADEENAVAADNEATPADKPFACQEKGCGKSYKSRKGLEGHLQKVHDKSEVCGICFKGFKTTGALTQHGNKEHGGETEPEPEGAPEATEAAVPEPEPTSNGGGDDDKEAVLNRVKGLLTKEQDYDKLLNLFQKVAGKRNVGEFTTAELLKLEAELQKLHP